FPVLSSAKRSSPLPRNASSTGIASEDASTSWPSVSASALLDIKRTTANDAGAARTCPLSRRRTHADSGTGAGLPRQFARVREIVLAEERLAQHELGLRRMPVAEEAHDLPFLEVTPLVEAQRTDVARATGRCVCADVFCV